ncbi:MAG: hypothetical protein JNL32_02415, partial [Candidatus Kapabacteria bacterium]|nr:hypothetical protein [Candidatus Kapabacteria bacterium]
MILLLLAIGISSIAWANGDKGNDEQRRSTLYKGGTPGSYPRPFNAEFANPTKATLAPAVSQGYYIVDSDDPADAFWKPYGFLSGCGNGNPEVDLNCQPETWYRIISGAHQFPMDFWTNNPEGNRFFQNPATKSAQFPYGTDST